jgi:DNA-binding beta-propeller fold protein YncE
VQFGNADGASSDARFFNPYGVAIDGVGNLFVSDTGNYTIRKITPNGIVSTLAGEVGQPGANDGVGAAAHFLTPLGLAVDRAGILYVADEGNHRIRKVDPSSRQVSTLVGSPGMFRVTEGPLPASLAFPTALAVTPSSELVVTSENAIVLIH